MTNRSWSFFVLCSVSSIENKSRSLVDTLHYVQSWKLLLNFRIWDGDVSSILVLPQFKFCWTALGHVGAVVKKRGENCPKNQAKKGKKAEILGSFFGGGVIRLLGGYTLKHGLSQERGFYLTFIILDLAMKSRKNCPKIGAQLLTGCLGWIRISHLL